MDTKKLRQKILDLAIRGKLVPQDPNDEPASVLIEKIRTEKERLIKEKKIKRDKNESYIYRSDTSYYEKFSNGTVKCIDEEIPFEIPESWEWCRLGSIVQHNTGKTLDKGRNTGKLFEYITTSNIYWEGFELESLKKMLIEENGIKRFTARKGDLLVCEGGDAGRSAVWECDKTICFQNHVHRVRPYLNVNSWYIYFFLYKIYLSKEIDQYKKGVGIQSLSGDAFASILMPLPPVKEQLRIVLDIKQCNSIVETIEENQKSLCIAIKQTKSKILDLAIRGKLVPQDPNDESASVLLERIKAEYPESKKKAKNISDNSHYPFIIPTNWNWCRLEDCCSLITDGTHQTPIYSETGFVFLSSKNVTSGKIDWENVKHIPEDLHNVLYARLAPQLNDILLAKNGTTGIGALVDRECVFDIYVSLALLRPRTELFLPKYLLLVINSPFVKSQFNASLKGIGVPNLHLEYIRKAWITSPPLSEQKRIVKKVEEIFASLEEMTNSIKA